jgi:hypothetical protein
MHQLCWRLQLQLPGSCWIHRHWYWNNFEPLQIQESIVPALLNRRQRQICIYHDARHIFMIGKLKMFKSSIVYSDEKFTAENYLELS